MFENIEGWYNNKGLILMSVYKMSSHKVKFFSGDFYTLAEFC